MKAAAGAETGPLQNQLCRKMARERRLRLQVELTAHGVPGAALVAQLRSQRGKSALAWLDYMECQFSTVGMATMVLSSLGVDAWRVQGETCPFACGSGAGSRSSQTHAMMCRREHTRGLHAIHTAQKRTLQRVLREHHVHHVSNEDSSMFKRAGLRADTAVHPGSLALCGEAGMVTKGFVLDTSVRSPLLLKHLGVRAGSAAVDGYAAAVGERDKDEHHEGGLEESRWVLVPFVQETYGRFGKRALAFIKLLAQHSAACTADTAEGVVSRQLGVAAHIRAALSVSLARELAERVMAYVRMAGVRGRVARPVSSLLCYAGP